MYFCPDLATTLCMRMMSKDFDPRLPPSDLLACDIWEDMRDTQWGLDAKSTGFLAWEARGDQELGLHIVKSLLQWAPLTDGKTLTVR